jgi:DUF1680 family protein
MIKFTRKMFALQPDIKYAEFHERALFNHVLGSMDPEDGRTCYMVPVGHAVQHEYQNMFGSFTCCVGSGMESHALHGFGLYYESGDKLWVNLYAPSTAKWESAGVDLTMETTFPESDAASLTVTLKAPKQFTLAFRRPSWAGAGFSLKVNGEPAKQLSTPGTYVEVKRTWKSGDRVTLALPKALHLEPLRDNPRVTAIMSGPIVLAGDLGPERSRERGAGASPVSIPSLIAAERSPSDWIKAVSDKPGNYRTDAVGRERDVELVPFYRLHRRTYSVYFDLFTPAEWDRKLLSCSRSANASAGSKRRRLPLCNRVRCNPSVTLISRGETTPVRAADAGRSARKWFR